MSSMSAATMDLTGTVPSRTGKKAKKPKKWTRSRARKLLVPFYKKHNPSKLGEVDKLLDKYKGNEEQMLRNVAYKYQVDATVAFNLPPLPPSAMPPSAASVFAASNAAAMARAKSSSNSTVEDQEFYHEAFSKTGKFLFFGGISLLFLIPFIFCYRLIYFFLIVYFRLPLLFNLCN